MFEKITKKKIALMFLGGAVLPLGLTILGIPLWIVTPISLIVSCMVDTVILYKVSKWIWKKTGRKGIIHN